MPADSFVHLHLHTEYSTLDGANRIPDVFRRAKEFGMPAVAITDHGNMFGAVEWLQEGEKAGVKPIVGCEVYMAPGSLFEKKGMSQRDASFHFTLLAENEEGYRNLVKLVSIAHLDGMYYKPRIDHEHLAKHARGLIGMSACLKGEVAMAIHQDDDYAKAKKIAGEYREILGKENFFLEIHDHGMDAQRGVAMHRDPHHRLRIDLQLRMIGGSIHSAGSGQVIRRLAHWQTHRNNPASRLRSARTAPQQR